MNHIDKNNWDRKEIFQFFSGVSNPYFMVSFTVDVTELRDHCRQTGSSFYLSLVYLCTEALNSVENFRYTLRDGEIYLLDGRKPSFTDLKPGSELFHITTVEMDTDMERFVSAAKAQSLNQTAFIEMGDEGDDLIYFSCLPQIHMTAMMGERDILSPRNAESNIPSLTWGKYNENGGRVELNIAMEVNHRFIDGLHIARFAEKLEALIRAL